MKYSNKGFETKTIEHKLEVDYYMLEVEQQKLSKESQKLSWSIFHPHEENRRDSDGSALTWRRTKCSGVFHMGNHVAIPSNQIGNRCEDGAVIEVQQCRGWLPMSKETVGQQGYSMSLERHSRSHILFMLHRAHPTPRKRRLGSGFLCDIASNASPNGFSFYTDKALSIKSFDPFRDFPHLANRKHLPWRWDCSYHRRYVCILFTVIYIYCYSY